MVQNRFWDSNQQRDAANKYAQTHGLDLKNEQVRYALRESYRSRGIGEKPGSMVPAIPKKIKKQNIRVTNNRSVITVEYKATRNRQEEKAEKDAENTKPEITHRRWSGETWNTETNEWVIKPGARRDFYAWYDTFIRPTYSRAAPLGKIHEQWCYELETDNFLLLLKPRDHFKTSIFSVGYSVYNLCEENLYPVLIVSKADLNTQDTFAAIKDHLENNPMILSFYGYIIDEDRKSTQELFFTRYQTVGTRDPALYCGTFGSKKVMGTHPRLAILDDIEEEELSPALMRQAKRMLDKSLIAGLPKGAKLLLVGTIKGWDHTNDIYLYARTKGIFSEYSDPAAYKIDSKTRKPILTEKGDRIWGIVDMQFVKWEKVLIPVLDANNKPELRPDGTMKMIRDFQVTILEDKDQEWMPIYPERYSIKDLVKKRIALKEVDRQSDDTFWSEFFLLPRKPTGNFFQVERLGQFPPPGHSNFHAFVEWIHKFHNADTLNPVIWFDPGGRKGHGIAMCVILFYMQYCYIIDMCVVRNGVHGAARKAWEWIKRYDVKELGCEANFEQEETFSEPIDHEIHVLAEQEKKYRVPHVQPIKNKSDKILRIQMNVGIVIGAEGSPVKCYVNQDAEGYQQFMNEFGMFPTLAPGMEYEWDILDCISSAQIHFHNAFKSFDGTLAY